MPKFIYEYSSPKGTRLNKRVSNSSRLILVEAEKHGVAWKIIPDIQIIELSYKGKNVSYSHQIPSSTTALAMYASHNKRTSASLLRHAGIKVPKGYQVEPKDTDVYLKEVYENLKKPLVVKPNNGDLGDNITVNIKTFLAYKQALKNAFSYDRKEPGAIVEEMFTGKEYRILATQDKVIGILNRVPANVIGDGVKSIQELIAQKNAEKIRSEDGEHSHLKIKIDEDLLSNLYEQDLTLESVIARGEKVFLRKVSNISKGGDAIDCTDLAHKSVKQIALKAMKALPGLTFGGIDFMTTDITKPQTDESYVIIEINNSPGFDIHDYPYVGKNRHTAREFLYLLYPQLRPSAKKNLAQNKPLKKKTPPPVKGKKPFIFV